MTSSKPYLVRALYQWILDNGNTPHILIDTTARGAEIPPGVGEDGTAVLNLAPQAVQNLEMSNDYLSFSARFNGVGQMMGGKILFGGGDDNGSSEEEKPKGPTLKVIK